MKRARFPMSGTRELPQSVQHFTWPVDLSKATWVRFEAWDIARNGAFTPTRWK